MSTRSKRVTTIMLAALGLTYEFWLWGALALTPQEVVSKTSVWASNPSVQRWSIAGAAIVFFLCAVVWFGDPVFQRFRKKTLTEKMRHEKLADLRKVEELFKQWSILRTNWEFLDSDVGGKTRLQHAIETNKLLMELREAAEPLLAVAGHFEIEAELLAMICNESHQFFVPGGERGQVEDRREIAKVIDKLSGCLQYGALPRESAVHS